MFHWSGSKSRILKYRIAALPIPNIPHVDSVKSLRLCFSRLFKITFLGMPLPSSVDLYLYHKIFPPKTRNDFTYNINNNTSGKFSKGGFFFKSIFGLVPQQIWNISGKGPGKLFNTNWEIRLAARIQMLINRHQKSSLKAAGFFNQKTLR